MDCVTHWQLTATCERISEAYFLPVLENLLSAFPFRILGWNKDNGSEYINHTVATLLTKLNIELTRSRPHQSNDNALVETENGAVVRKHLGYSHIPQRFAAAPSTSSSRPTAPSTRKPPRAWRRTGGRCWPSTISRPSTGSTSTRPT